MLAALTAFVDELRRAGLPISLTESIDAVAAAREVGLGDREELRSALLVTLVKSPAHVEVFGRTFDVFFSARSLPPGTTGTEVPGIDVAGHGRTSPEDGADATDAGAGIEQRVDAEQLKALVRAALSSGDASSLAMLARLGVRLYAGIEPGRPVGVSYYLYRTLRGLDLETLVAEIAASGARGATGDSAHLPGPTADSLGARLVADELRARAAEMRRLVEAEIRRILVAERGVAAVQGALRRTPVDEVDFMHATGEELARMRRAIYPLARSLAARLARRRRHRRRGSLDFRATIRRSLSTGGVAVEPRFRAARPAKPEIVVIADVSGSVASFSRFTLHLVYAMAAQFTKVRSFVFVDGIDEVTAIFSRSSSVAEAIARVSTEADVVHLDGHSDYGHALGDFAQRWGGELNSRTSVIVLGDARNNYHAPNVEAMAAIARRARCVYWLNPEPRSYWGSGDSIADRYAPYVTGVYECRNLRQLESFVETLA